MLVCDLCLLNPAVLVVSGLSRVLGTLGRILLSYLVHMHSRLRSLRQGQVHVGPIAWEVLPQMLSKSAGDKLKLGLLIIFLCSQPDFRKATAVPREATRAQKSPCPAITSSRSLISPSICSKAPGRSLAEGVNFSLLAPTK